MTERKLFPAIKDKLNSSQIVNTEATMMTEES
jgi:hypothetical protein